MQKFIRIMAIVAVALAGLSMCLLLITIPFQSSIAAGLFNYPEVAAASLPQFPLLPFIFCCLRLGCMALLILCCGNKKGGFWLELVVFACLVIALPAISRLATPLYTQMLVSTKGEYYLMANNVVSNIANYCLIPSSWGQAIAYAACGMSIVFKQMSKKSACPYEADNSPLL